jgi:hypothetical protein
MSFTTTLTNSSHRELGLDELDAISAGANHIDGFKVLAQASAGGAIGGIIGGGVGVLGGVGGAALGAGLGTAIGAAAGAVYEIYSELTAPPS